MRGDRQPVFYDRSDNDECAKVEVEKTTKIE